MIKGQDLVKKLLREVEVGREGAIDDTWKLRTIQIGRRARTQRTI